MTTRPAQFLAFAFLACALPAMAGDWPQWRGPDRTGVSRETGLLKEWPKDGPKLLWKAQDIGKGYSTPSIAGDRVYFLSNRDDEEYAIVLDAGSGKQLRSVHIGKVGKNYGPQYPGTRCTPTIDDGSAYCLSSDGDLVRLELETGKIIWRKSLTKDFGGKPGAWAYSESPLIDGDVLVCTPGGSKATLAALNKNTGEILWTCAVPGGDQAGYASVIIGDVGGKREYIQFLQKGVIGVDAKTGKFLWRYAKTGSSSPANIPTPVFHDGYVFSSTAMGGGGLAKITAEDDAVSAKEVYFSKKLNNGLGGMVEVGKYLYGTNTQSLVCADFLTGKVAWENRSVGKGSTCYADGDLYVRSEKGDVALVEATPDGYREKGRFSQPDRSKKPAYPYPVIANGRLYLRDQDVLLCYDVRAESK